MSFQEIAEFFAKQWPSIVGVAIIIIPITWIILEYLYKTRLEEKGAEIRQLQERIKSIETAKPSSFTMVEIVPYTSVNWDTLIENATSTFRANGFALVKIVELNCRRIVKKIKENDSFFVEIFLGDPFSTEAAMRARDEGDNYLAPQKIALVAVRLEEARKELRELGKEKHLILKHFSIYPTMALVIIDDTLFVYFYPYGKLGTDSPIIILRNYKQNNFSKFFLEHFEAMSRQSSHIPYNKLANLIHLPT